MMVKLNIVLTALSIQAVFNIQSSDAGTRALRNVESIRFLVSVNVTYGSCIATVSTPPLRPGIKHNATEAIHVAKCDHGALDFNVTTYSDGNSEMSVDLVFHSSTIENASPPTCSIPWNGSYLVPSPKKMDISLLPGCSVSDSREGHSLTYYWFYILEWTFG